MSDQPQRCVVYWQMWAVFRPLERDSPAQIEMRTRINAHLKACPTCSAWVDWISRQGAPLPETEPEPDES